jgi:hypothetical protein
MQATVLGTMIALFVWLVERLFVIPPDRYTSAGTSDTVLEWVVVWIASFSGAIAMTKWLLRKP